MPRKKLNNILFPIALVSFVVICSCNPNEVETDRETVSIKRDTLDNWLTVNVTFQPTAPYRLRIDYLDEIHQYLLNYVGSGSDSARNLMYTPMFRQTSKDSLRYTISVDVDRLHSLKDSISDPRPPCPPRPGPRSIEEAIIELDCALEG